MELSNFQDGLSFLLEKYKNATPRDEINNKLIISQLTESEMKHKTLRELYIDKLMHDNLLLEIAMASIGKNEKMVQQLIKNKTVIDHIIQRREQLGEVVTMDSQVEIVYQKCIAANKLLKEELLHWVAPNKRDQIRTSLLSVNDDDSLVELFCRECKTNSLDGFHKLVCILETVMLFASCCQSA